MDSSVLIFLYNNPIYLDYLRHHPKWYPVLDDDNRNLDIFINEVKKELKLTPYDRLEDVKKKISFVSSMINYFTEKN